MDAQTLYVIYAEPKPYRGPSAYLDRDGNRTTIRVEAVAFYTDFDARLFAREMSIRVNMDRPYIDTEEFPPHEEPYIWTHV